MPDKTVGGGTAAFLMSALTCFICISATSDAALAANGVIPIPRPKPAVAGAGNQTVSQIPNDRGEQGSPTQTKPAGAASTSCYRALRAVVPSARREASFRNATGCGMPDPVVVDVVAARGSAVALSAKPMLSCKFARKFATWISDVVAPLARQHMGAPLVGIHVGPGYDCRTRNRAKGAKLSEHSFGTAIDLMSFTLANKTKVSIGKTTSANARRFLKAVRATACGYFTTVLGPGSNAAHDTHYHVDIGKHGRSGHYRICE